MATVSGGKKLEAALREMAAKVAVPATLRVGFLENAKYPDGTSVAMVAAINEYGRPPVQPPRPYFRNMIKAKSPEWPAAIAGLLKANDMDAVKALDLAGAVIAGQLRESIRDLTSPPLKDSTIVRKGGTRGMKYDVKDISTYAAKPLIDTGHMLDSVDHEVKT